MTTRSRQNTPSADASSSFGNGDAGHADVIVFVEDPTVGGSGICHSQKVAGAFGGKVVLVHVQCRPDDGSGPIDPVEWDIRKQQARKWLEELLRGADADSAPCEPRLLEGDCVSQIQSYLARHPGDIAAVLKSRGNGGRNLSETAWGVLLSRGAGVLIIPQDARTDAKTPYERILVPLDGSARAEAAVPRAVTLARAEAAELVLCHVAPKSGLSHFGATDHEAQHLQDLVTRRNEQAGKIYLSRIRNRLAQEGLKISARISSDGDARRTLIGIISREKADFVVMATHGESGHKDVPTGDVARYVLDRAEIPVLLVRPNNGRPVEHVFGKLSSEGLRQPGGTD